MLCYHQFETQRLAVSAPDCSRPLFHTVLPARASTTGLRLAASVAFNERVFQSNMRTEASPVLSMGHSSCYAGIVTVNQCSKACRRPMGQKFFKVPSTTKIPCSICLYNPKTGIGCLLSYNNKEIRNRVVRTSTTSFLVEEWR